MGEICLLGSPISIYIHTFTSYNVCSVMLINLGADLFILSLGFMSMKVPSGLSSFLSYTNMPEGELLMQKNKKVPRCKCV